MLQRSLVEAGRGKPAGFLLTSNKFSSILRVFNASLAAQQRRAVATTSSSKNQQLAHQRKRKNESRESDISVDKHQTRLDHLNVWQSVDTIKRLGYRLARLDPLEMSQPEQLAHLTWQSRLIEELMADTSIVPTRGFLDTKQPLMAVNELVDSVLNMYANQECGLELAHMTNECEVEWLQSQWEKLNELFHLDHLEQQNLATLMLKCETFDHFMAAKCPTTKRYGCEGAEPMLVVLDETLRLCHLGAGEVDELTQSIGRIDDVIIGMPHRGRLNLLACLLGFEPMAIFSKTRGEPELDLSKAWMAKGDVLSHLSTNCRFVYGLDRHNIGLSRDSPEPINVTLLPNPSHLEVASPMTMGTARGRAHNIAHSHSSSPKFVTFDEARRLTETAPPGNENGEASDDYARYLPTILPIQIHGDAALAGQGIIQETLQMANLAHFTAGGSLHLVVNNQIGYTTEAEKGRSSRNCTDIFKLIEAPIIHVNARNISSVVRATRLALTYRQKFGKDVALNLVCYRQHGHNEMDEPSFTQPLMYANISKRKSIPQLYCDQIGMEPTQRKQIVDKYRAHLQEAYKQSDRYKPDNDNYRNFQLPTEFHRDHLLGWQTGADLGQLRSIGLDSVRVPDDFRVHANLERALVRDRKQRFLGAPSLDRVRVDWALAEILAFGSLLRQNHPIRLAGQDVARGTFSTRHAVLFDQNTQRPYIPLNEMQTPKTPDGQPNWAKLEVANTVLSEEASLAYEFAYSVETCELTLWEAQFGDFFNTAQSIIDTLVSSSESKWLKQSPLTLLLPHGMDGAGPEHSSSHIERFLQMSSSSASQPLDTEARVNWSVCFPTLPSQYFHLLRRQVLRPFRKPLIVMSPKVIFRHPECQSDLAEFGELKTFQTILDDPNVPDRRQIDTVVLCSGKVYFALSELKLNNKMDNVALVRIEELCPFPVQAIIETLKRYPNIQPNKCFWFQEEHKNQGAYSFVATRLANMANIHLGFIGRSESELPATGSSSLHKRELEQLNEQFKSLKQQA